MNLCIIFNNEEYCENIDSALSDSGTSLLVFSAIFYIFTVYYIYIYIFIVAHYSVVETIMYVLNSFIYLNIATMHYNILLSYYHIIIGTIIYINKLRIKIKLFVRWGFFF